jgi:hypothetical protein
MDINELIDNLSDEHLEIFKREIIDNFYKGHLK